MNVGGLATVQPIQQNSSIKQQQTATPEQVKIMTCDGDTMSAASLELRSRFTGSIEKMKIISERAKKRQENARPAIIKREREDQQKYHRRYMELAMKQHAEQQAKTREINTSISSMHHNPAQINLLPSHNTPYNHRFASAPGTSSSYITATPTSTLTRQANNRKRQYDHLQGWASSSSQMCSPIGAAPMSHSTTQNRCNNNSISTPNIQHSYNISHCPPKLMSPNDIITQQQQQQNIAFPDSTFNNLTSCQNMDIMNVSSSTSSNNSSTSLQMLNADNMAHSNSNSNANLSGNSNSSTNNADVKRSPQMKTSSNHLSLSTTALTSPNHNTSSENLKNDNNTVNNNLNHNQTVLPELADSQMKNLIDQFEAGNPLNDLGDGCLEDVLSAETDQDTDQQSSTSTQHVVLPSNNITPSPINHSLTSVNSNSIVSPTSLTGVTGTTTPTSMVPNTPTGIIPNTPTGMISTTPAGMLSNASSMPSQPLPSTMPLSKVVNASPSYHHSSPSSLPNNSISNGSMIMTTSATPTDSQTRSQQQQQQQSYSIASTCSNSNNTSNNPLGVPLGSSTPSTSASNLSSASTSRAAASSCCFSQLQSTSSFAPSHALSAQQQQARSRVPYPTGMTAVSHSQDAALLRHQQQQQQHQMMMQQTLTNTSNHHLPQLQPQQPYIYPSCMNGTSNMQQQQQMGESNALLQMRQSVDELSTNIEKRSRFALRFAPCASDYSNMDANSGNMTIKTEIFSEQQQQQQQQSFIANNRMVSYPTNLNTTRPMHPQQTSTMSQPQQLFNPYHQVTRQRSTLDNTSTPEYSYQMRMNQTMNQQMAMYPMNGQMLPHQQQFTQQYYPSRNVYSNYRYC